MLRSNSMLVFSLAISFFGMITTAMLALGPPSYELSFAWRKPFAGSAFAVICVTGILASFRPKICSRIVGQHTIRNGLPMMSKTEKTQAGHHPDCGRFSDHVVQIRGKTFCAACLGLASGALIALAATTAHFSSGIAFFQADVRVLLAGYAAVVVGLMQFRWKGYTRLMLNALFVIGGFVTLAEIDEFATSVLVDTYTIIVLVSWILTRIQLSVWDHARICGACNERCGIASATSRG